MAPSFPQYNTISNDIFSLEGEASMIPLSLLLHTSADLILMGFVINCALIFHFLIYCSKFLSPSHAFSEKVLMDIIRGVGSCDMYWQSSLHEQKVIWKQVVPHYQTVRRVS